MKYHIVVDTNQLFNNKGPLDQPFNTDVPSLLKFLDDHKVTNVEICIPQLVIQERIQHKLEEAEEKLKLANGSIERLKELGHKIKSIKKKNYRAILQKNAEDFIKKNGVRKLPLPTTSKKELVERALVKMRPFADEDVGFKDTLIYLSIVGDAMKSGAADQYIFCTDDDGFNGEVARDFESQTGKKLHIVPSFTKVREKLDELLPLNLHLEKRNNRIKEIIGNKIGSIMVFLNQSQLPDRHAINPGWVASALENNMWLSGSLQGTTAGNFSDDIVGFDFANMSLSSIDDKGNDKYVILANVDTVIRYKNKTQPDMYSVGIDTVGYDPFVYGSYYRPDKRAFTVQMTVDMTSAEVSIGYATTPFL